VCDCDYCISRNISYISDPSGIIKIKADVNTETEVQGSEQARFLVCSVCKDVIAATLQKKDEIEGALNANLLNDVNAMMPSVNISPKAFNPVEKLERWTRLWSKVYVS
jgi:hypothetical protein